MYGDHAMSKESSHICARVNDHGLGDRVAAFSLPKGSKDFLGPCWER